MNIQIPCFKNQLLFKLPLFIHHKSLLFISFIYDHFVRNYVIQLLNTVSILLLLTNNGYYVRFVSIGLLVLSNCLYCLFISHCKFIIKLKVQFWVVAINVWSYYMYLRFSFTLYKLLTSTTCFKLTKKKWFTKGLNYRVIREVYVY